MTDKTPHPFRKKWGQNFLIDPNIVKKIYRTICPIDSDNILEIGPGEGVLTKIIIPEVNKMVSIEIDPVLVNKLNNSNRLKKLKVVNKDILKKNNWKPWKESIELLHKPNELNEENIKKLRERLAFDEALSHYIKLLITKENLKKNICYKIN